LVVSNVSIRSCGSHISQVQIPPDILLSVDARMRPNSSPLSSVDGDVTRATAERTLWLDLHRFNVSVAPALLAEFLDRLRNRSHPHFYQLAVLGMLHIVWPRLGPERLLNNFIHRESFVDSRLARSQKVELRDWLRPRQGRTDWHRIARRLDYTPRLRQIAAPTLVLCGRYDPQFPRPCSEELAGAIPGARLVVLERSGHYPFIEEPRLFSEVVGAFLRDTL
jgi:pimeloyl-ACP methyl ester carboxylesterase